MTRLEQTPTHTPAPTPRSTYRFDDYPPNPDDIRLAQPVVTDNLARQSWNDRPQGNEQTGNDKEAAAKLRLAQMPRPKSHMDNLPQPGETQEQWYARIIGDYYRFFYATAYPIVRNASDAEDAVQTAVLNGFKRLDALNDERAIVSWMAMIVRNAALDIVRKRKRTAAARARPTRKRSRSRPTSRTSGTRWMRTSGRSCSTRSPSCPNPRPR